MTDTPENLSTSVTAVNRDYHSGKTTPYRNVLHTDEDVCMPKLSLLDRLLRAIGAQDGDEVEITVRKTGERPFGDRRFVRGRPHRYAPETDEQMRERSAQEQGDSDT